MLETRGQRPDFVVRLLSREQWTGWERLSILLFDANSCSVVCWDGMLHLAVLRLSLLGWIKFSIFFYNVNQHNSFCWGEKAAALCRSAGRQVRLGTSQSCFFRCESMQRSLLGWEASRWNSAVFSFSMTSNAAFSAEVESFSMLLYHLEGQVGMRSVFNFVMWTNSVVGWEASLLRRESGHSIMAFHA